MTEGVRAPWADWALVAGVALLAGCASGPGRAPIEDRPVASRPAAPVKTPSDGAESATKEPPGAENAGKPGYYTVKPGDALIRIGLEVGQNWRDIARWNNIDNPNLIEVGQVLRVAPPGSESTAAVARPVTPSAASATPAAAGARPAAAPGTPPGTTTATGPTAASGVPSAAASSAGAAPAPTPAAREPDDDLQWGWPAVGPVAAPFDDGRTKGMAISGKAGDPVFAAADGRVVYAGSGLRGYGNLVIIKHNATYLTAYAHNQSLLVKEDQVVRRGQRIAEMGSTDADRVQLHFEIRRQGKPIDPVRLLPAR